MDDMDSPIHPPDAGVADAGADLRPREPRGAYRPMPADFVELFPRLGWDEAKAHWRCHGTKLAEWLAAAGKDEMKLARQAYRESLWTLEQRKRRRRYLAGKTRTAVGIGGARVATPPGGGDGSGGDGER